MRRVGLVILAAWLVLAVGAAAACPSTGFDTLRMQGSGCLDAEPVPALPDFLRLLASGGGAVLIGTALSLLFEKVDWFKGLGGAEKGWVSFGASVGIPLLATALILYVPEEVWNQLAPFWMAGATALLGWLSNQGTFLALVKPGRE